MLEFLAQFSLASIVFVLHIFIVFYIIFCLIKLLNHKQQNITYVDLSDKPAVAVRTHDFVYVYDICGVSAMCLGFFEGLIWGFTKNLGGSTATDRPTHTSSRTELSNFPRHKKVLEGSSERQRGINFVMSKSLFLTVTSTVKKLIGNVYFTVPVHGKIDLEAILPALKNSHEYPHYMDCTIFGKIDLETTVICRVRQNRHFQIDF